MAKKEKKKGTGIVKWSVLTAVMAIIMIGGFVANYFGGIYATTVNIYLGTSTYKVVNGNDEAVYFTSDFSSQEELEAYEAELCATVEAEGAALLTNENSALPLASGAKVSLFARGSVDLMYGGTGSGSVDTSAAPTLLEALTDYGIEVNQTLWDWYVSVADSYSRVTPDAISDVLEANTQYAVNEAPWSEVEAGAGDSFAEYGDAAIVVFSRSGGEGADLPAGDNGADLWYSSGTEGDGNYLELSAEELELLAGLKELKDEGVFQSIIVLLNTSNAIELDFLDPDVCGVDYGVDACMWIGDVGQTGANGVAQLLSGEVSPSGSLVDTYWYDNLANPAVTNFYAREYSGASDYGFSSDDADYGNQAMYSVYQEGIYLGYRYTETRYEDVVMGTANVGDFDYATTVAYAFGYGISYTTFEYSDYTMTATDDGFEISVTVTNTGDTYSGKKTVQVYFQSPYTDYDKANGIEKASVELCGYAKTDTLAPGESETVTITVDKSELRTYDSNNAQTYILDAGDYYFTIGNGSHDAVNNILAAKGYTTDDGMTADGNADLVATWTQDTLDTEIFATSEATGTAITNLFDEADPNKASYSPGEVTWLSRSDWEGTYPTGTFDLTMNDELAAALATTRYDSSEVEEMEMPTLGADNGLNLSSMIGKDYDDEDWDLLLDQLTYSEMVETITLGFHNTKQVNSVSKPATSDENGPQGLTASLTGGDSAMCYTSEDVMAATFNDELIYQVGLCIGEDCLGHGYSGLYGPGINMHRTAYSGRNFEYYSEDPFIAGTICANEVQGIQSKGVYVYLKHVALNDSETSREGVGTWLNEQAAREIYLEVADKAIVDGGAWCVMSGFNRWGAYWCGEYYNLQTAYLRDELGLQGMSLTDFSGYSHYMDLPDALIGGTDIYDSPATLIHTADAYAAAYDENDPYMIAEMKEAMHRILYTVANSNAMNGWDENTYIKTVTPWWQTAVYAIIVVGIVGTIACAVMLILAIRRKQAANAKQ
ncbi:MAG: glycoside hydrolase family 3 C-terminal domain-containing protein [Clostridiales bacterium]|nr:glycoside hydrolase family 3 C-terminal domain-containing protein [Clostridiales bacterium]